MSRPGRMARLRATVQRALPVLRVVGFVASVAIVVAMVVIAVREVPARDLEPWLLGPALLAAAVWYGLLGCGWAIFASGHVTRHDLGTWFRTQVLRYLPGGIWAPVSRVAAVGGGAADRLVTVAAENVTVLCAALAVGGLALAAAGEIVWVGLVALLVAPRLATRFTAARTRVGAERTVRATAVYTVAFVVYAVCAVLVQRAVTPGGEALEIAGAAALAWGAGLVVIIAPGGVGVRELAYVGLLSGTLPRADLAAAAVTMRAVTVVAELAVLLLAGRPSRDSQERVVP